MKTALRAIAIEAREGYIYPNNNLRHLRPMPTVAGRVVRAVRWATYEAREHLALWFDPGP